MPKILKINNKSFLSFDTTVLYTSEYNYTKDAIAFLNKGYTVLDINTKTNINDLDDDLLTIFKCSNLKEKEELTLIDNLKITILNNLNNKSAIIVFLNILTYLDKEFITTLFKYLKNNHKQIINYTTNIEEALYLEYIIVINENCIIMEGRKEDILLEEKILKKLGFNLPFIIELSKGLKYYGLINKIYYDNESLVTTLWN